MMIWKRNTFKHSYRSWGLRHFVWRQPQVVVTFQRFQAIEHSSFSARPIKQHTILQGFWVKRTGYLSVKLWEPGKGLNKQSLGYIPTIKYHWGTSIFKQGDLNILQGNTCILDQIPLSSPTFSQFLPRYLVLDNWKPFFLPRYLVLDNRKPFFPVLSSSFSRWRFLAKMFTLGMLFMEATFSRWDLSNIPVTCFVPASSSR